MQITAKLSFEEKIDYIINFGEPNQQRLMQKIKARYAETETLSIKVKQRINEIYCELKNIRKEELYMIENPGLYLMS